jgi:glucokinase
MIRAGVDIGGTKIKLGLVKEEDGTLMAKGKIPFVHEGYKVVFGQIAAELNRLLEETGHSIEEVGSMGLAVPGSIDREQGRVIHAHNLDFHDVPAVVEIKRHFPRIPVYLGNDANAAALGELCCGAFRGYRTAVLLTIGTGVGGGIICEGKMFNGGQDHGVELGHMMLKYGGLRCSCGNYGCVEAYCTATWLMEEGRKLIDDGKKSLVGERAQGNPQKVDGKMVVDAARDKDPYAMEIMETFVDNLSAAITSISALMDPEIIAIGGGISGAGDILFQPLREKVKEKSFFKTEYNIVPAHLGNDAGIIGAAYLYNNGGLNRKGG